MTEQKRTVIAHYHIYKNSGTSFDHVLTHSFGDTHELFDGPYPFFRINQMELEKIIRVKSDKVAFSSHQIILPQPSSLDFRVIAAVFLRNPILRVASIYRFKRKTKDGTPLSAAAMKMEFGEWIEHCLSKPGLVGHISNAQTRIVSAPYMLQPDSRRRGTTQICDLDTARRNINNVELLGRTENFEADVTRFIGICAGYGLTLSLPKDLHRNVTQKTAVPTAERVRETLDSLPAETATKLQEANQQDVELYDMACELIEKG